MRNKWKERIDDYNNANDDAIKEKMYMSMKDMAYQWPFCAIGENRARLETIGEQFYEQDCVSPNIKGQPKNTDLCQLGYDFYYAIACYDMELAMIYLKTIEKYGITE